MAMLMSEKKKQLRELLGWPLTTKGKTKNGLGYKQYNDIRQYFHGLAEYPNRSYFTDEVIERILGDAKYYED